MKARALIALLAASFCVPAFAGDKEVLSLQQIVDITGMKKAEVQLMVGAYSNNRYYRTSFHRVSREWDKAVYENGLLISYERDARGDLVMVVRKSADAT